MYMYTQRHAYIYNYMFIAIAFHYKNGWDDFIAVRITLIYKTSIQKSLFDVCLWLPTYCNITNITDHFYIAMGIMQLIVNHNSQN